jgi:protein-S-isoprenylcysteine O-methyltransferase Ste14
MLCLLLGTGFIMTPVLLLVASMVVFIIGTEIRVRIEDKLLESRFGDRCRDYKRAVPAYIPFVR